MSSFIAYWYMLAALGQLLVALGVWEPSALVGRTNACVVALVLLLEAARRKWGR